MAGNDVYRNILLREGLPGAGEYLPLVRDATRLLGNESERFRPRDALGRSGGLLRLVPDIPAIIVPDLHGRMDFFLSVMRCAIPDGGSVEEALRRGDVQVLCLGDGFHAEARGFERWKAAYAEYARGYRTSAAMDAEMREDIGLMEMVMRAKLAFPERFHFLKGNHENILNEEGEGNHAFGKFVLEGAMVFEYMVKFYGEAFLLEYAAFEKSLPLLAVGSRFMASHAEPLRYFAPEEVVDARLKAEVILGLTWTDNGAAEDGSVDAMLDGYLPEMPGARYFGGHRVITGLYRMRAGGRYVQIHNPDRFVVAWVMPGRDFDPAIDVGEIRDLSGKKSFWRKVHG